MLQLTPRLNRLRLAALALCALAASAANAHDHHPLVVTSLKPLELLVRAVGDGEVDVATLVPAGASPHTYQLRPSQRRDLEAAELVFWIGPGMENFLNRLLTGPDFGHRSVALANQAEETGADHHPHDEADDHHNHGHHEEHGSHEGHEEHEGHDHPQQHDEHTSDHDHDHHSHGDHAHDHGDGEDPHTWLDPGLALDMARDIARHLKTLEGVNAERIDANLARFTANLQAVENDIQDQLQAAKTIDLFTYHNAFSRFAEHYGLTIAGVLTMSPERTPGARHLAGVQEKLRAAQRPCLLTEPQFNRQWWDALMEEAPVAISTWDPLASDIPATAEGYVAFQQSLADAVLSCLSQQSQ